MGKFVYTIIFSLFLISELKSQTLQVGVPILEEYLRREQLLNGRVESSFLLRPISVKDTIFGNNFAYSKDLLKSNNKKYFNPKVKILPIYSSSLGSIGNPYPEVSNFVISKGFGQYFSAGIFSSIGPLSIQIQPEFIYSQNLDYDIGIIKSNNTEYLERFGDGYFGRILPGQSSIRLNFGAFSLGASTENIWWGPGQFNSLLFSNNAFGFEHLTLNTRRPAKTFLGSFEGQLIVGKLENAYPDIISSSSLRDDWRYLNGITFN